MDNDILPSQYGEFQIHGDESTGLTIAYRHQWIDGIFDTMETAKAACDLVENGKEDWIVSLWAGRGDHKIITTPMIRFACRLELGL